MIIVLHVPQFPLQATLRNESATSHLFHTHPAALFNGTTKRSVVLACNDAARAAGITPGMSAPQAAARCPTLLVRTSNADAETDARATLLAAALLISPHVEDTAPGIATLDAHGLAPAARAPACTTALARLAQLGLSATAGIARTPLLARYAASSCSWRAGSAPPPHNHVSHAFPILAVTDESAFLAPLPLAAAEPDPELANVLHTWGIHTCGELTALARDDIGQRLGAAGAALWDRARGGEPRPLHLITPPREFVAAQEFEDAFETLDPLLFVLRRFLDRLTLELEAAHFVAVELVLTLTLENENLHRRSFRLPEPTRDATILFRTLHTHLESLRTDAAIIAARLRMTPARPLVRQHGLFETGLRDPHGFAETLARVSALIGSDRIGTPQLEDTHRPDAVKLATPSGVIPPPAPPPPQPLTGRPLRRFRPPLPARFAMSEGQPSFLWTERVQGTIAEQRGPWFSSGEWWQTDRAWTRAEWDIALTEGGVYRLFRTAEGWFLEGEYD